MEQREAWYLVGSPTGGNGGGQGLPVVHCRYRMGLGPHLYRARQGQAARGGLMGVELGKYDGRGSPEPFCAEVLRECQARRFSGVVCRFPATPLPGLSEALGRLAEHCSRKGLGCWVSEPYGDGSSAGVLIPTAISGGSLEGRLRDAVRRFGAERVAVWLDRSSEDFALPSPHGSGRPLSPEELEALRQRYGSACFFSDALCARYFTYMEGREGHFVLFDDLASLQKKLSLARQLGIGTVFLPAAELGELTEQLVKGRG